MLNQRLFTCVVHGDITDISYVLFADNIAQALEIMQYNFPYAKGYDVRKAFLFDFPLTDYPESVQDEP